MMENGKMFVLFNPVEYDNAGANSGRVYANMNEWRNGTAANTY